MKDIARKATTFVAALGFALFTGAATATAIDIGQWYTFGFDGDGGDPLISGAGFSLGARSVAIGDPAWTFDCPTDHCKIIITDGFLALDEFELFDNLVSIGTTSPTADDPDISCGNDELACLADPNFSHGIFFVSGGAHSITGTHLVGIPGAGFLFVSVPEPGMLLLMGAGLLALFGIRRRA